MEELLKVVREYKDTVFRLLFRDKPNLLMLYNALNETAYDDPEELEVCTLENAIFMNVKNDVSFLVNSVLNLYEQQSSVNPNMPLRDLIYVARQFEKYIRDKTIYSSKLVRIPVPRFVVFYNGTSDQPEKKVLKLSEAFKHEVSDPDLELKVTLLNINLGHNKELLDRCQALKEYSIYVDRVRKHAKVMPIEAAVQCAVDECIQEGVLADFLKAQKAEVIAMSIFEYNEEIELKKIREDEYSIGLEDGKAIGEEIGKEIGKEIGIEIGIRILIETCQEHGDPKEETVLAVSGKYGLPLEKSKEYVDRFWVNHD